MLQSMVPLQAKPVALIVGNETEGIADEIIQQADVVVQIPMSGLVESLNVGVATSISLYDSLTTEPFRALSCAASITRSTSSASWGSTGGGPPISRATRRKV